MENAPRYSLFAADTLAGLKAARAQARTPADIATCDLVAAAVAASDRGETDQARELLARGLADTSDVRLLYLGFQFHFRLREYDTAERLVRRRLALLAPDSPDAARSRTNLGLIHHFLCEYDAAEQQHRLALAIDTAAGNEVGMARALGNLALVPESRGDLDEAERLYHESLAIAERIGAKDIIASKLNNLGEIAMTRGNREQARSLLTRAAALFAELGLHKYLDDCEKTLRSIG